MIVIVLLRKELIALARLLTDDVALLADDATDEKVLFALDAIVDIAELTEFDALINEVFIVLAADVALVGMVPRAVFDLVCIF